MEKTIIALVQMQSIVGAIEDNLAKIGYFVQEAHKQQADFICFPELSVTGYCNKTAVNFQEPIPGASSKKLSQLAQDNQIAILAGICEENAGDKPYITQVLCLSNGEIIKYRKTHLGVSEQSYFSAGDCFMVERTNCGAIGLELCWEMHFPEITTILTLNGAEIIFVPHASPIIAGDRKEVWLRYMSTRAYDNCVYLAACNALGENGCGTQFSGGALVIGPKGEIITEDFSGKEGMLVAALDNETLNRIRYSERRSMRDSFYLNYRRPELYGDLWR